MKYLLEVSAGARNVRTKWVEVGDSPQKLLNEKAIKMNLAEMFIEAALQDIREEPDAVGSAPGRFRIGLDQSHASTLLLGKFEVNISMIKTEEVRPDDYV